MLADSVIAVTPVGEFPQALEYNPFNNDIYVANVISNTISVIYSSNNMMDRNIEVE
ncbi:MAG: hypothetical protein WBL68_17925 [Nitrososphaeraceae archaeon]